MFSLVRVIARMKGQTPEDYAGAPGGAFRRTIRHIGAFWRAVGVDASALGEHASAALSGAATHKHSEALKNVAEKEKINVQTGLLLRSADAHARKDEAEALLAEVIATNAVLDLTERLNALGVALVSTDDGRLIVLKAPGGTQLDADSLTGANTEQKSIRTVLSQRVFISSSMEAGKSSILSTLIEQAVGSAEVYPVDVVQPEL